MVSLGSLGRKIELIKAERDAEIAVKRAVAHVYQIGAPRQIISPPLQVNTALLARTPNLIAASSNGAGYDTIDVDACTEAGIAVVNQSGGN
jgi:D-3-phosphoglycerate dehydrogenase